MRPVPFTVAAAVGALLLLGACTDSDSGSGSGSSSDSSTSGSDAGKDSAAKVSPLNAYLKSIRYDGGDSAKLHEKAENIIASCMKEAGFEYTPQEVPSAPAALDDPDEVGLVAWAEKYGYGYQRGPEPEAGEEEVVSPDADYLAAMSESEAVAYSLALFGDQDEAYSGDEYDWTKAGCHGKANHETYSNLDAAHEDPAYEDLQEEMRRMFEKVPDDPRLAAITAEWSACMNEVGFDFAKVGEARDSIAAGYAALPESGGDETTWADLGDKETATAIADATCQTKVGYPEKAQEVQFALEQEFIDTHKAELDAWVEQYATDEAAK